MSETPGGNEIIPQTPKGDDRPDGKLGYPPPGQAETLAAIKAKEEAQDNNPEAILAELEVAETPTTRKARLGQFVETHFAGVCPPEHRDAATGRCEYFEEQYRELFGESSLQLSAEDASDPELKKEIENIVQVAANDEAIAAQTEIKKPKVETVADNAVKIDSGETKKSKESAKTPGLKVSVKSAEGVLKSEMSKEFDKESDLSSINQLKADKGTIGALKTLLEAGRLKSPEMKTKVQSAVATAQALVNAIPGKSEVVNRILDQSNINFAASSPIQIFAGFLAEANKSSELTDDEKAQIREVLHGAGNIKDSSDLKLAIEQGRGTRTLPDGTTEIIPYDAENRLDLGNGLSSYLDGDELVTLAKWDGKSFEFRANKNSPSSQLTDQIANFIILYEAKVMGITDATDMGVFVAQGTSSIDLNQMVVQNKSTIFAERIRQEFLGMGAQSRFPNAEERQNLRWFFQWMLPTDGTSGDGGAGDNSVARQQKYLGGGEQDGLFFNKDGDLNEDNLKTAALFLRDKKQSGAAPDFQVLKDHVLGANDDKGEQDQNAA